jgi:5'-3' exonuclease
MEDSMNNKRLLVDLSSIMWTCMLAGTDTEFGKKVQFEGKPFHVNSAAYGYENAINHLVMVMTELNITPINMIMVMEGMSSKLLRQSILPNYKGGDKKTRPEESYVEFGKLRQMMVDTFLGLGATMCTQDGIEADDILAYLALNLKGERIIDTNDGDLTVLITEDSHDIRVWRFGKGLIDENPYGPFPCKYITVYKALVGDTSDKVPGCPGFGQKAWLDLLTAFGWDGLELMEGLIVNRKLDDLQEDVGSLSCLKRVIEQKDMVYKSYDCAKLYPNKINTMRKPLEWKAGMVKPLTECKDARLKHWYQQTRLVSRENFDAAMKFLVAKIPESPFIAFDCETSTNDVSDEWLAAAKAKSTEKGDDIGVDVYGSKLTGYSLTFGANNQYTYYCTVDHVQAPGCTNLMPVQAKQMLDIIPREKRRVIQNVAFELPVIMKNLGPINEEVTENA